MEERVKIILAMPGNMYPSTVFLKAGLTKGGMVAPKVKRKKRADREGGFPAP